MRSSAVPLVPLSVQKGRCGQVATVITRMLVINRNPTERGLLFRLSIVQSHRLRELWHSCRYRAAAIAGLRSAANTGARLYVDAGVLVVR